MKIRVSPETERRIRQLSRDCGLSIDDLVNDAIVSNLPKLEARFASGYSHIDIKYEFSMRGDVTAFNQQGIQIWRIEPSDELIGLHQINEREILLKLDKKPNLIIDIVSGPPLKK